MRKTVKVEAPLACNLGVFGREQGERHRVLLRDVFANVRAIEELPDGYAFELPGEASLYLRIAEWVTLERLCCPFLAFGLDLEHDAGPIRLRLTGAPDVKRLLRVLVETEDRGVAEAMVTPRLNRDLGAPPGSP